MGYNFCPLCSRSGGSLEGPIFYLYYFFLSIFYSMAAVAIGGVALFSSAAAATQYMSHVSKVKSRSYEDSLDESMKILDKSIGKFD